MAQNICLVELDNGIETVLIVMDHTELLEEDARSLAYDNSLFGSIEASYEWYNVGEGESGMDCYFSSDDLEEICYDEFLPLCEEKGLDYELVQSGIVYADVSEDDNDWA